MSFTSQNPLQWNPSWLSDTYATRKNPESEWLARDSLETNPITIKPKTEPHGRPVLLGSLTILLSTRGPLPSEVSCFVNTCVSSANSFLSDTWNLKIKSYNIVLLLYCECHKITRERLYSQQTKISMRYKII